LNANLIAGGKGVGYMVRSQKEPAYRQSQVAINHFHDILASLVGKPINIS
jgi:hypothetical protein